MTLKILESITFASNLSAELTTSILKSLDTKYSLYLIDMTASIKTSKRVC
jgi:hypothetical protein